MDDKAVLQNIDNYKVRQIIQRALEDGLRLIVHGANPNIINIHCPIRKRNVIGDVHIDSKNGYFSLQNKTHGKWVSFRTLGMSIEDESFVSDVLSYIR